MSVVEAGGRIWKLESKGGPLLSGTSPAVSKSIEKGH